MRSRSVHGFVLVLLTVLLTVGSPYSLSQAQPSVEVVAAPDLSVVPESGPVRMMRAFLDTRQPPAFSLDPSLRRCVRGVSPGTLAEVLGSKAVRIVVQKHASSWGDLATVANYIRRLLPAPSENGAWFPFQMWSEGTLAEIDAWVESSDGPRRPLELGNGYAHAMDAAGCEWWARYLGPDRSRWVVR